MRKYSKRIFAALISLLVVTLALRCMRAARAESTPQGPGQLWLSWSSDAKAEYVWGFLSGFEQGKLSGCSYYAGKITPSMPRKPLPPEKLPKVACVNALPNFQEPSQNYIAAVTDYYNKYPSDRQAGMPRLLMEMAASPGITTDEIHAKLSGLVPNK